MWAGHASHGRLRDGRALALIGRLYTGYSILSGICLTFCASSCKGRNTTARNSNFPEQTVDEKAGDVIYGAITRQMYHAREQCALFVAVSKGRTTRSCDVCQICQPETGTPVVVTATESKYHCSGCRTVAKPTPVELLKCPICFDKSGEKTE